MKCFATILSMTLVTCGLTVLITLVLATCAHPELTDAKAASAAQQVVAPSPQSPAEGVSRLRADSDEVR